MLQQIKYVIVYGGILQALAAGVRADDSVTVFNTAGADPSGLIDATYTEAIAGFHATMEDFDTRVLGELLSNVPLVGFSMNTGPALIDIVAADQAALGQAPPSPSMAARVLPQTAPVLTQWNFSAPVLAWDLVLIDFTGPANLEIEFENGTPAITNVALGASAFPYQWVGVLSEANAIERIRLLPLDLDDYAFDNVRTAVVPEPAVPAPVFLLLLVAGPMLLRRRRRA